MRSFLLYCITLNKHSQCLYMLNLSKNNLSVTDGSSDKSISTLSRKKNRFLSFVYVNLFREKDKYSEQKNRFGYAVPIFTRIIRIINVKRDVCQKSDYFFLKTKLVLLKRQRSLFVFIVVQIKV